MTVSKTKEWRMKAAELAKAYMAGGEPPYQAARKTGFMRVAIMEEAIRELENAQGNGVQETVQESAQQETVQENEQQENRVIIDRANGEKLWKMIPAEDYCGDTFHVREFAANGPYKAMIRIWAGDRPNFIYSTKEQASELLDLLRQVVTGKKRTPGTDERDETIRLLKVKNAQLERELKEMKDAPNQAPESDAMNGWREKAEELERELEAERALNRKLKDKLIEMMIEG